MIAVDLMVIYALFPASSSIGMNKKVSYVQSILDWANLPNFDAADWNLVQAGFAAGVGDIGTYYLTGRPFQVALILRFAISLNSNGLDSLSGTDGKFAADEAKKFIKDQPQMGMDVSMARNTILHLLYPDQFESIASQTGKSKIFQFYKDAAGVADGTDIDDGLLSIRDHLVATGSPPNFNFYEKEFKDYWDKDIKGDPNPPDPPDPPSQQARLKLLASSTHMQCEFLTEINDLLLDKRQIIFEGPPGSGKTFVAEKFARWFAGDSLDDATEAPHVETVQFHQSYGYEDFVQGIRPETTAAGGLSYAVKDGIFKRLCERARDDSEQPYVLLIDEINRGNIARIFGELLYLLEYRNRSVSLPYAADGEKLTIPKNLYIIGTMNSADRSLAQVDYALRRRFYFIRFMPVVDGRAPVLEQWLQQQPGLHQSRRDRILSQFIHLNTQVEEHLTADVQVGHSYFMPTWIADPGSEQRIWRHAVRPLLEEYFHHHKDRETTIKAMTPDFSIPMGVPEFVPLEDVVPEALDAE
jgi:hypothetical protein